MVVLVICTFEPARTRTPAQRPGSAATAEMMDTGAAGVPLMLAVPKMSMRAPSGIRTWTPGSIVKLCPTSTCRLHVSVNGEFATVKSYDVCAAGQPVNGSTGTGWSVATIDSVISTTVGGRTVGASPTWTDSSMLTTAGGRTFGPSLVETTSFTETVIPGDCWATAACAHSRLRSTAASRSAKLRRNIALSSRADSVLLEGDSDRD